MKCPKCDKQVNIKKNQLYECQCGARLLTVEIKKELKIFDLRKDGKGGKTY